MAQWPTSGQILKLDIKDPLKGADLFDKCRHEWMHAEFIITFENCKSKSVYPNWCIILKKKIVLT